MNPLPIIIFVTYVIGYLLWARFENEYHPFEEGDSQVNYYLESEIQARSLLWPVWVVFIVCGLCALPAVLLFKIIKSLCYKEIMGLRRLIHKIKDYDRLERDYCTVLDTITGGMLSKPGYSMDTVQKAIENNLKQRDDVFLHAISNEIGKLYEKYEGNPLIEGGLLDGFEDIINDYYEKQSLF